MEATYFKFTQSLTSVYSFSPTLDDDEYTAYVKWNIFGQRYYVHLYDSSGTLIFCRPLISSGDGIQIDSMTWDNGIVTVTTTEDHGYMFGEIIPLNISGSTPTDYNDVFECLVTGTDTFTFKLDSNPGLCTVPGSSSFEINISEGYFSSSRLVYRGSSSNFEVWS